MSRFHSTNILGNLEKQVMEIVWKSPAPVSVTEVVGVLTKRRPIAYTTVMTIMSRLVNKGVLTRSLSGSKYLYRARINKDRFAANAIHKIFSSAVSSLGEEVVVHFMKEIQKLSPKRKKELGKLLDTNEQT